MNMTNKDGTKMETKLVQCNHCGNKGNLDVISSFDNLQYDYCDGEPCYWWNTKWYLLKCPVCGDAVLYKEYTEEANIDRNNDLIVDSKIAYPSVNIELKATPEDIKTAYEAAIKTMNIHNEISLLSFRTVLEKIVNDKGGKGSKLIMKINDLTKRKILPQTLKDCGSIVRILGNAGAHGDNDISINKNDIQLVKKFVENIIEYVYELPAETAKLIKKFGLEGKIQSANEEDK